MKRPCSRHLPDDVERIFGKPESGIELPFHDIEELALGQLNRQVGSRQCPDQDERAEKRDQADGDAAIEWKLLSQFVLAPSNFPAAPG